MSAVPITSSAQACRLEPTATDTFQRAAGIAGLVAGCIGDSQRYRHTEQLINIPIRNVLNSACE